MSCVGDGVLRCHYWLFSYSFTPVHFTFYTIKRRLVKFNIHRSVHRNIFL